MDHLEATGGQLAAATNVLEAAAIADTTSRLVGDALVDLERCACASSGRRQAGGCRRRRGSRFHLARRRYGCCRTFRVARARLRHAVWRKDVAVTVSPVEPTLREAHRWIAAEVRQRRRRIDAFGKCVRGGRRGCLRWARRAFRDAGPVLTKAGRQWAIRTTLAHPQAEVDRLIRNAAAILNGRWRWSYVQTAKQGIVHRPEDAVDEHLAWAEAFIECLRTNIERRTPKCDVHQHDQLIDRHCSVPAAVAVTPLLWRRCRRWCERNTDTVAFLRDADCPRSTRRIAGTRSRVRCCWPRNERRRVQSDCDDDCGEEPSSISGDGDLQQRGVGRIPSCFPRQHGGI